MESLVMQYLIAGALTVGISPGQAARGYPSSFAPIPISALFRPMGNTGSALSVGLPWLRKWEGIKDVIYIYIHGKGSAY